MLRMFLSWEKSRNVCQVKLKLSVKCCVLMVKVFSSSKLDHQSPKIMHTIMAIKPLSVLEDRGRTTDHQQGTDTPLSNWMETETNFSATETQTP